VTISIAPSVLIGLIGRGVGPSLTPLMHELEGARHGLRYIYRSIDFTADGTDEDTLRELIRYARTLGFDGLNLTYPVKQTAVALLDGMAPAAQMIGAVNTVRWEGDRLIGYNTDISGFRASLIDALGDAPLGRTVAMGAGGAGSAVCHAAAMQGVERLTIVDVDLQRAEALAHDISSTHHQPVDVGTPEQLPQLLTQAAGLINATPMGMAHHPGSPVDQTVLRPDMWVCDIVYRPVQTALLAAAKEQGCRTISGLGMAMHQAADAFEIFTGETADRQAMLTDLRSLVAAEQHSSIAHR
jgi:shikimate dehydrogenase